MATRIILGGVFLCGALIGCGTEIRPTGGEPVQDSSADVPLKTRSVALAGGPSLSPSRESDGTQSAASDSDSQISGVIRHVFQSSNGSLWLAAEDGLFRHDGRALKFFDIKNQYGQGVTVKEVTEDRDGVIWCVTTGGVTRVQGDSFVSFSELDGLICDDAWSIAAASDGTIWIGTLQGACRFDGQEFVSFAIPEAEPDRTRGVTSAKIVHCIMEDSLGKIWLGTNGGAYIYDGKSLANLSTEDGLSDNVVHAVIEDQAGSIWLGTTHGGLCRYDGTSIINVSEREGVDGKEVWGLHEDHRGDIWFSVKGQGIYCYDGDMLTSFTGANGPASRGIMCIYEDKNQRFWFCGVNGLFRFDGSVFSSVTRNGPWK